MGYNSSPQELENFMRSNVWKDFKQELEAWLEDIHVELEDLDGGRSDKLLHRLGGNAETVKKVLRMPEVLIMNMEDDMDVDERER